MKGEDYNKLYLNKGEVELSIELNMRHGSYKNFL